MTTHLEFLRNLQRLLTEGVFVATYKLALLQSLADLTVERQPEEDGSMRIAVADIAEKFIQYYWRQALPYRGVDGVLRQNSSNQAAIINRVEEARAKYGGALPAVKAQVTEWRNLRSDVAQVVRQMPLWKLQVVAGESLEFIYRRDEYMKGEVRVLPGAVSAFRDLYVIVSHLVKGAWVSQIQRIGYNRKILGDEAGLPEFLFGSERESLDRYKRILKAYQNSRCFYCEKSVRSGELDHFIPWSRYPVDLGHNFVFSHCECNRHKRDFLAHPSHLVKWFANNIHDSDELSGAFSQADLVHDVARSTQVTMWAYEQGEAAGAYTWLRDKSLVPLDSGWKQAV